MKANKLLYEGKAKKVFHTDDPALLIQYFKDDATAFNAKKRGLIQEKGRLNNLISEQLFQLLEARGVRTHFVKRIDDRSMLIRRLDMFPLEVVVRNVVAGSLAKRLDLEPGRPISPALLEWYYKNDDLGDPLINKGHIRLMNLAGEDDLHEIAKNAILINDILRPYFDERNIILVDFKLEFGISEGAIILGDEIGPDTCRFLDKKTGESMDKDRFRRDLGKVEEAYQEVYRRVIEKS